MKIRDARSARKSDRPAGGDVEPPDDVPAPARSEKAETAKRSAKGRRAKPTERARGTASGQGDRAQRSTDKAAQAGKESKPSDTKAQPVRQAEPTRDRAAATGPSDERSQPVFDGDAPLLADADGYQERWDRIQIGFVDEPLYAVESAGRLVAEVLGELASTFAARRKELESQWRHDNEISTEELRVVFRGYRAFFNRIIR